MILVAGDWRAEVRPEHGGALATLTWRGRDVLRATPADATAMFDFASFALVPYANRIAHGAFDFEGLAVRLAPNAAGQAHPLHGVGWLRGWEVVDADEAGVTLVHRHEGDAAWPWRYVATQRIALSPDGLAVSLEIENDDARAMPVSLGFHPYFTREGVESVAFIADGVWRADADMLPTDLVPASALGDWSAGAALERADLVDHCYTGWRGRVEIVRDDATIVLSAEGADHLHLFVPPSEDFFCAEPVTAMPDAVNREAAAVLATGQTRRLAMAIGVE